MWLGTSLSVHALDANVSSVGFAKETQQYKTQEDKRSDRVQSLSGHAHYASVCPNGLAKQTHYKKTQEGSEMCWVQQPRAWDHARLATQHMLPGKNASRQHSECIKGRSDFNKNTRTN